MNADYKAATSAEQTAVADEILKPRGLTQRKVLIIGNAGYIGTVVTAGLLAAGYAVRGLDLFLFNNEPTIYPFLGHPNFDFHNGDLAEPEVIEAALDGVTDVVLLAGLVGDPITKKFPEAAGRINDDGYQTILSKLNGRGLNKVIFVSTCSNYGLIEGDQLADENFELNPLSLYAKSKVRVEQTLLGDRTVDYRPTVLRFATAFGLSPRMRFDLTVSEFTRALHFGEDLLVYDADTWRPYCHVMDFVDVIGRVLAAPRAAVAFEVFNAGGEVNNYTKQMIVDAVLEQIPEAKVRYQEHGADPRNYRVDFKKIRKTLFFEPQYTVPDGVRELIAAMRSGLFHQIDSPASFYGNWDINYSVKS